MLTEVENAAPKSNNERNTNPRPRLGDTCWLELIQITPQMQRLDGLNNFYRDGDIIKNYKLWYGYPKVRIVVNNLPSLLNAQGPHIVLFRYSWNQVFRDNIPMIIFNFTYNMSYS